MRDPVAGPNLHQAEVAVRSGGALIVVAGAGPDMTHLIAQKIAELIAERELRPWNILSVSSTGRAAHDLRLAARGLMGSDADDVQFSTFHTMCLRTLRRHAARVDRTPEFVIYGGQEQEFLLASVLNDLSISAETLSFGEAREWIGQQQDALRGPAHAELPRTTHGERLCGRVYSAYEASKQKANAFDFGDVITKTVALFEHHPEVLAVYLERFEGILVDGTQVFTIAQRRLLTLFAGERRGECRTSP